MENNWNKKKIISICLIVCTLLIVVVALWFFLKLRPSGAVTNEVIQANVTEYFAGAEVTCSEIQHTTDAKAKTDCVIMTCLVVSDTCEKTVSMQQKYTNNGSWQAENLLEETTHRKWRVKDLAGKTFSGEVNPGEHRTVRINSFDSENQTMEIEYGETTLNKKETCTLTVNDYEENGRQKQSIVLTLENDSYNVELREDGLYFGAKLSKQAE
ncbi:MAG: hypothetical protein IJF61_00510 [Clostridia bacterium]|nr:hypothetical protein [Clostridia bacterium]